MKAYKSKKRYYAIKRAQFFIYRLKFSRLAKVVLHDLKGFIIGKPPTNTCVQETFQIENISPVGTPGGRCVPFEHTAEDGWNDVVWLETIITANVHRMIRNNANPDDQKYTISTLNMQATDVALKHTHGFTNIGVFAGFEDLKHNGGGILIDGDQVTIWLNKELKENG